VRFAVRGGLVVGRASARRADVLVDDGVVVAVGPSLDVPGDARVIDAAGCWVGPGFVDLHAHLREPGNEEAETIASGARAAARGGYSAVVAMPNTEPPLDSAAMVAFVLARGREACVEVAVAGTITQGRRGELLAPLAEMAALGVRLFTDDGLGVQDPLVMRRAMEYARPLGVRLGEHCEDERLAAGGSMHEGALSSRLGLVGRPALAEELMVQRDLELVALTGCALHLMHLSTARSLALVAAARARGLPVTCEVTPHHLSLDETAVEGYDPTFKVHPPLRPRADADALCAALVTGEVDAVATDHAPHAPETKDRPFDQAPPGVLGLEHAAALTLEALGAAPDAPQHLFRLLSRAPARIAGLDAADSRAGLSAHGGALAVGEDANLVVFDPAQRWTARRADLASRARNTPYDGREMHGRARALVVRGRPVLVDGELA
jgi:dihydroorotase